MDFRRVKAVFQKDALDLIRTRPRLIAMLFFPLLMVFFFGVGFGGEISGVDTLVVGETMDNGHLGSGARQIETAMIHAENHSELFRVEVNNQIDYSSTVRMIERGEYDAVVYIPKGYPSENVKVLVDPTESQQTISAVHQGVRNVLTSVRGGMPPVEAAGAFGDLDYIDFLAPAIIVMTIFFGAGQGTGRSIAGEKEEGTLDRLAGTPASANDIIAGKTAFAMITQLIKGLIIVLAVTFIFHVTMNGSWLWVGLIILLMTAASVGVGLSLSAMAEDESTYAEMSMVVILPAMFVSGVFFPVSAMPFWIQPISYIYPLTYANNAIRQVMLVGSGMESIMSDILILIGMAVGLYFLGVYFFNKTTRG